MQDVGGIVIIVIVIGDQICALESTSTASDLGLADDMRHGWHCVGFDLGSLDKLLSHVDRRIDDCEVLCWNDGFLEDDIAHDNYLGGVVQ